MRALRVLSLAISSLSTPVALTAQTPLELIGLAGSSPGHLVRQQIGTCDIARCALALRPMTARPDGGTAYDATRGAVWVSDGAEVALVDAVTCRVLCPPHALPGSTVATRITGLAVNEAARVLVATDARNLIAQFRLACPVSVPVAVCDATATIPAGHQIGGVATDDVNDLVIFSSSDFAGPGLAANVIHISRRSDPCSPICRLPVPECAGTRLGPIEGVAFDPCRRVVWATDGTRTVGMALSGATPCTPGAMVRCCTLPAAAAPLVGLCLVPSRATEVGRSCTNLGCASCPGMVHNSSGDPAIGNPGFSLDLVGAPAQARVAMWVNAGPCRPIGIFVPPFCGPILMPLIPPPIVINLGTGGTIGCTGTLQIPLRIPLDPALCGGTLSSQCFGLCPQSPFGTFVSNCLSWQVSGS